MSDRHDFDLDPAGSREPLLDDDVDGDMQRRGWIWAVVLVLVGLLAAGAYWWMREPEAPEARPEAAPTGRAPAEEAPAPEPDEVATPPLAESDPWIRAVAEQLSAHPRLASWLAHDELARRFVAAVDNFADGISPRNHIAFAAPDAAYRVDASDGTRTPAPANYDRYAPLVAAVDSLHVEGTADLYRRLEPLFDEAYRDLGYPDRRFRDTLARAMRRVLDAPLLDAPPEVVSVPGGFAFADPDLEALDDATKHLLRLGPDNLTVLKRKVRRLADAVGLDVTS